MNEPESPSSHSDVPPSRPGMEIWAVAGETHKEIIGYLLTDSSRWPSPIAFVRGGTSKHAMIAALIRDGKLSPDCRDDLRGRPIPHWLCGQLLFPLDISMDGQQAEDGDRGFVAAMFRASDSGGAKSFTMLARPSLERPRIDCLDESQSPDSREAK